MLHSAIESCPSASKATRVIPRCSFLGDLRDRRRHKLTRIAEVPVGLSSAENGSTNAALFGDNQTGRKTPNCGRLMMPEKCVAGGAAYGQDRPSCVCLHDVNGGAFCIHFLVSSLL